MTKDDIRMIRLVAAGYSNAQIGTKMIKSTDSVKSRLLYLFRYTGARSRAHLVALAYELNILRRGAVIVPRTKQPFTIEPDLATLAPGSRNEEGGPGVR